MASRSRASEKTECPPNGAHVGFHGSRSAGVAHASAYLSEGLGRGEFCFLIGPNSFVDSVLSVIPRDSRSSNLLISIRAGAGPELLSPFALLGKIMEFVDAHPGPPKVRLVGCPEWLAPAEMLAWESLLTPVAEANHFPWLCIHDDEIIAEAVLLTHPFLLENGKIVSNRQHIGTKELLRYLRLRELGISISMTNGQRSRRSVP